MQNKGIPNNGYLLQLKVSINILVGTFFQYFYRMKWEHAIKDYEHYLKIERGLSSNSIQNYCRDVIKLIAFLNRTEITETPISITKYSTQQFIYEVAKNVSPRSQARIISGLTSVSAFSPEHALNNREASRAVLIASECLKWFFIKFSERNLGNCE